MRDQLEVLQKLVLELQKQERDLRERVEVLEGRTFIQRVLG